MRPGYAEENEGGAGGPGGRGCRPLPSAGALSAVVLLLLTAACGGGGEGGGAGGGDDQGRLRPATEQPPADDVEAVEPLLTDLLERHDEVVNEVLADPGVARDDSDPLIEEYLGLYGPDTDVPEQVVEAWVADADAGRSTHPVEAGHPAMASRIDGEIQVISDDQVRFPTCSEQRYASYGADGSLIEVVPYREQPGEATAVRVEGQWLLLQLDSFEGQASCHVREATEDSAS